MSVQDSQKTKAKIKEATKEKISTTYSIGLNSSKRFQLIQDVQLLAQYVVSFMQNKYPDYEFKDFYDPVLIIKLRNLIKNEKAFREFLNNIHFEVEQFFNISVYLFPQVYTSYLIKFIKETYLVKSLND